MNPVSYRETRGIAVVTIDHPPVNALSVVVREGLGDAIAKANADDAVRGIVLRTEGSTFVAGADIKEMQQGRHLESPTVREIQDALQAGKPSVAAIHGAALGGGLELALACTFRVALPDAQAGLPEVKLGLLPGAGGTQRITRLCGPATALDIVVSGRKVPAQEALSLGVFDALVDDTDNAAIDFLNAALETDDIPGPILDRTDAVQGIESAIFEAARAKAERRGAKAPLSIIDCIETACRAGGEEGLAFERAAFDDLKGGDQNKALTHAFFAERAAAKLSQGETLPIQRVGIVGAGLMGSGIAIALANKGISVELVDRDAGSLEQARARIDQIYEGTRKRGLMSTEQCRIAQELIGNGTDYTRFAECDLAIEAVPEKMELKEQVFAQLDEALPPHAILATNTSSLDIDRMAAATKRPGSVIGLHFFSPAHIMKLVEVVRGEASTPDAVASGMALVRRIGKVGVVAGNCDGFIANRSLQFYTGQAEFLMEQGASPEQIDRVAEEFGMPMGPVAMRDMAGLDVAALVREVRAKTLPPEERLSPLIEKMVEAGRLGQKSGAGFYRYSDRKRVPDPEAIAIIQQAARELGVEQRSFDDDEIRARLFLPIVNEGARELEEGIAMRAGDIDVAWINGYGFPAHRGGPMHWGEQLGLDRVVAMAERLGADLGPRWQPSALLKDLAANGRGWAEAGY